MRPIDLIIVMTVNYINYSDYLISFVSIDIIDTIDIITLPCLTPCCKVTSTPLAFITYCRTSPKPTNFDKPHPASVT